MSEPTRPDGTTDATLPTTDVSRDSGASSRDDERALDAGARLGRYELVAKIGAGGMGVVWTARDPDLDRIVAVKILRARAGNADGELRLRREGQTMAKLVHPNVIRVYDVGIAHGSLFVAMEYVAGGTLHDWLERSPRSVDEIIAAFGLAGRGLAAAHATGLVHRDVKPSNILVGDDGRVLVTDFGLARPSFDSTPGATPTPSPSPESSSSVLRTITREGGLVGTPAFMAPEQLAGGPVDARADQFAFAVALWRALYKRPPYSGDTADDLAATTRAGVIDPPPAGAKVPAHVRTALVRALSPAAASRFPSMHPLLTALADDPRRRRRQRILAAAIVIAAVGAASAVYVVGRTSGDACGGQGDRFRGVWDPEVAAAVERAFAATHLPYADASFHAIAHQLDQRKSAWEAMRLDSCLATRARGEQSDAMMDARANCLELRLGDVAAFTALLRKADRSVVQQAPQAVTAVGDVAACADVATLARRLPPPDDPVKRGAIAALDRDLADARAQAAAAHWSDVAAATDALIARARATAYPPVVSEALELAAEVAASQDKAADGERLLDEAELSAEAGGDDEQRFQCEVGLVRVVGYALERLPDGERHAKRAQALLARLGPNPRHEGQLAYSRALALWWNGSYADARTQAQAAVDAFTRVDARGVDVARALHIRAIVEQEVHDLRASVASEEAARAIAIATLGADHPFVAETWNTAGGSLRLLGEHDQAVAAFTHAIAIHEISDGPDSSAVGATLMNEALVYLDWDKPDGAIPLLERARDISIKRYGDDHSRVADVLDNLGAAYSKAGRNALADATLRRAIAVHSAKLGKDAPATASSWKQLGYHLQRVKQYAGARDAFTEAVRAVDASQGASSPLVVHPLVGLGDVDVLMGDRAGASRAYTRALALVPADEPDLKQETTAKLAALKSP